MELLDSTDATALGTSVTSAVTANMPGILAVLGIALGLTIAFGLLRFGLAKLGSSWKS